MTAPTDDHLRELLALWSGPGVVIAKGHLIRALAEEVLALREIQTATQGVIAAIPAALETARREGLTEAAIIAEADAESAFRASGFVGGRIDKIGPKIRALIPPAPESGA